MCHYHIHLAARPAPFEPFPPGRVDDLELSQYPLAHQLKETVAGQLLDWTRPSPFLSPESHHLSTGERLAAVGRGASVKWTPSGL